MLEIMRSERNSSDVCGNKLDASSGRFSSCEAVKFKSLIVTSQITLFFLCFKQLVFLLIFNAVPHINLGCFECHVRQGNVFATKGQTGFCLSSSLKLLKILRMSSSISLYIPEHLCRLPWLGCLSYSGYFVSSGNTFVETSISLVPACHHLAETVYFSLPLKWNWKFPICWIVLKWTRLPLRLSPPLLPGGPIGRVGI